MMAEFTLGGRPFMASDSPVNHAWGFTPAISIFIACQSAEELDASFNALAEGGQVYMEIDNYGFSRRFGWVGDRFGVTWQLNLE
jgi:predicted 3-demethylubiquinone-9 3-methyltransferase (glyoxalase superfamily)